ncbi:MAG: PIN domain-containing protein [Pseudomonadota bacterium]
MILIDSDVLIWLTRGHTGAKERLGQVNPWRISTLTYMELAQGCRNKDELVRIKRGFAMQQTEILPVTPAISEHAMALIDEHALADGLLLADALIAATAIEHQLTLLTGNARHFAAIAQLKIERFDP